MWWNSEVVFSRFWFIFRSKLDLDFEFCSSKWVNDEQWGIQRTGLGSEFTKFRQFPNAKSLNATAAKLSGNPSKKNWLYSFVLDRHTQMGKRFRFPRNSAFRLLVNRIWFPGIISVQKFFWISIYTFLIIVIISPPYFMFIWLAASLHC